MQTINDLRKSTGMSRKEFCETYDIPYMTMTDWELGHHSMPEYTLRILSYYVQLREVMQNKYFANEEHCHVWEEQKNYITRFPVIEKSNCVEIDRIHPLKQSQVIRINERLREDDRVTSAILFGSSVCLRCNINSDTDIAIRLAEPDNKKKNEISEIVQDICDWKADIIWFDSLRSNTQLYNNILKGVQIV